MPLALKIEFNQNLSGVWGHLQTLYNQEKWSRLGNKDGFYSQMGEGKLLQSSGGLSCSVLLCQQPTCVVIVCSLQSVPPLNNW